MGRVVVGVDGSSASKAALAWALDEARARGATLEVVTAWSYLDQPPEKEGGQSRFRPDFGEDDALRILDGALAEVAGDDPGVEIIRTVVCELAPRALLDASAGADLVVVGARGLGGVREALLGSVSQEIVHHATCPVVVVRKPSTKDDGTA